MTNASPRKTIPMACSRRICFWVRRYGAFAGWLVLAGGLLYAIAHTSPSLCACGVAESVEVTVAPVEDGVVAELALGLLDEAAPGDVVVRMDERDLLAELAVATAELERLRAQFGAESESMSKIAKLDERDTLDEQRRFAMNEEEARIEHLLMLTQQETDTVELERLRLAVDRQTALVRDGLSSQEACDEARLAHAALKKKVEERRAAVTASAQRRRESAQRQETLQEQPLDVDLERILDPIRKAAAVQEARIAEIQHHRKGLALAAPLRGQITQVCKRPGETVLSGEPILILRPTDASRVVVYLNERTIADIPPGARAQLRSHYRPVSTEGEVVRVGSQVELMPPRLQPSAMAQEHGLLVVVGELAADVFYPGERVDVVFDLES